MSNEGNTRFTFPQRTKESEAIMVLLIITGQLGLVTNSASRPTQPFVTNIQFLQAKQIDRSRVSLSLLVSRLHHSLHNSAITKVVDLWQV